MKRVLLILMLFVSIKAFGEVSQPELKIPSVTFPLEIISQKVEKKPPLKPPEQISFKGQLQIKPFSEDIEPIPPYYVDVPVFDIKKPGTFLGFPKEKALLASAIDEFTNGRLFSAKSKLIELLENYKNKPETATGYYLLGIVEHKLGNMKDSFSYFKKACLFEKPFNERDYACFSAALVSIQLDNILDAEFFLPKVQKEDDNTAFLKGILHLLKGNKKESFKIIKSIRCEDLDLSFIDYCRYAKGYLHFWHKDFADSLKNINALSDSRYKKHTLVISGFDYLNMGNIQKAKESFSKYMEGFGTIDKISDYVIYGAALIDIKEKNFQEAFDRAGVLESRNKLLAQSIYIQLASAYSKMGKFEDSLALLQKSLQISPEYKDFLKKKLAVAAYNSKKYQYAYMLLKNINEPLFKLYTAFALLKIGNVNEAENYLREALESGDKSVKEKALKYLADIYYYSNEDKKFLETVKELSKYDKNYAMDLLGWFFFKKKLYDKAEISFHDLYMKAVSAFNNNDFETAKRIIEQLNNRKAKFLLAYIYLKQADLYNAREVLKSLSEGNDQIAPEAAYMYAYSFFSQGDYERAIQEFENLIKRFPDTKEADRAYLKMADAYFNLGDKEKARQIYQDYISKHANTPEAIDAAYQLALLEMKESGKDITKQLEDFIKKYPQYPFVNLLIVQLADAYVQDNDFENAEKLYKMVIEKDVEESEYALYKLAYMKFKYGRKGLAVVLLREYLNKYPEGKYTLQVKELLAQAFEALGKIGDAIVVLKELPKTPENQFKLATLLFKNGDYTEAKSYFEDLYNRFPEMRNDIAYYLGKIQYELGYYENALKYLNEAIKGSDYNHVAESYYLIGIIYREQGKKEEALNNIINVIYLYPEAKDIVYKARLDAARLMKELGKRYEAACILKPVIKNKVPLNIKREALKLKKTLPECME
ncbi:MAG: outer membrane protein assembly factor BamD [Aquificota bacterium]|nr:MAG: outer membrane protein assembly factor BamD [Aquificota bacterium]